jgi:protoheme IX farnesyltransferase
MLSAVTTTTRVARDINGALLAYVRLTKPRIILLLVITTVPAMILADGGLPSPWLILATVLGGSVVAGGANALNMYFDRDIDELMLRTRDRPVPAGQIEPEKAALFGLALALGGFLFLEWTVNLLAAALTLAAFGFYVLVYTIVLKRVTPLNIVIGGAAGAMPPVIGWAAVNNELAVPAFIMFAIVTLWTPPHFWALSLNYSRDYERAGVPMLPVVAGPVQTKRQIFAYSLALFVVSLLLAFWSAAGVVYFAAACALGAGFIYFALRLLRSSSPRAAADLFRYSIAYLGLLFCAIAFDVLVRA